MKSSMNISSPDLDSTQPVSVQEEETAEVYEARIKREMAMQFQRLKDEARSLYGMVDGRPGVRSPGDWEKLLERAGDDIGNDRFIVRCLGAERYLDAYTVAVLITLRQNLLADLPQTTAANIMRIDSAVLSYYNMLRIQGWVGNLALVVERKMFGEEPLNEFHGDTVGNALEEQFDRLAETMLPLLGQANRMMLQGLKELR